MSAAERWIAALVAGALVIIAIAIFYAWPILTLAFDGQRNGKAFYVASESMWPTLRLNDRIIPRAIDAATLRRGMVIVIQAPDTARIYRIAGIAGDRVAVRGGHVIVNGVTAQSRSIGGAIVREQFPSELGSHRIADVGQSMGDDTGTVLVPSGKLYLLGDNRDRSADSRFGEDDMGVGLVDRASVIGSVDVVLRRDRWRVRSSPVDRI